jgi:hypothetical protein
MRGLLTEKNIVVVLFIMVLVTFSFAQNETKKMEQLYSGGHFSIKKYPASRLDAKASFPRFLKSSSAAE